MSPEGNQNRVGHLSQAVLDEQLDCLTLLHVTMLTLCLQRTAQGEHERRVSEKSSAATTRFSFCQHLINITFQKVSNTALLITRKLQIVLEEPLHTLFYIGATITCCTPQSGLSLMDDVVICLLLLL